MVAEIASTEDMRVCMYSSLEMRTREVYTALMSLSDIYLFIHLTVPFLLQNTLDEFKI